MGIKKKVVKRFGSEKIANDILEAIKFWQDTKDLQSKHNGKLAKGRAKRKCDKYEIDWDEAKQFYFKYIK